MAFHSEFWLTIGAAAPVIAFAQALSVPRVSRRSLEWVTRQRELGVRRSALRRFLLTVVLGAGVALTAWGVLANIIGFWYALAALKLERDDPVGMFFAYWGAVGGMAALAYQLALYVTLDLDVVSDDVEVTA